MDSATKHKRIRKKNMKNSNYMTIRRIIESRRKKGFNDWDDDLEIINGLVAELGTVNEDFIMSIYSKVVRIWDKAEDD